MVNRQSSEPRRRKPRSDGGDTLADTVDALIAALLKDYRDHPRLLTALSRMVESEPDSAFAKEIMRLSSANMEQLAKLLLGRNLSV